MDPNANLAAQAQLLNGSDKARLRELREALQGWLAHAGFSPDWKAYPEATAAFITWQKRPRTR